MMVTAAWGMDSTGYTVAYVGHWSSSVDAHDPVAVVRATGELARKTALSILGRLPEPPLGDGRPPGVDRMPEQGHWQATTQPAGRGRPRRTARPCSVAPCTVASCGGGCDVDLAGLFTQVTGLPRRGGGACLRALPALT